MPAGLVFQFDPMNQPFADRLAVIVRLREQWWFWPLIIIALVLSIPWFVLFVLVLFWLILELFLTGLAVRQLALVRT